MRQTVWHIGVLFRITIDNVRTEGATLYGQLPLTLIIDTDLAVTDCDWLVSPQTM